MAFRMKINGQRLTLVERTDSHKYKRLKTEKMIELSIGNNPNVHRVWLATTLQMDDLLKITDHDTNKIDFAYPKGWADKYCRERGIKRHEMPRVMWSHEGKSAERDYSLSGWPLWEHDVLRELEELVTKKYNDGDFEILDLER